MISGHFEKMFVEFSQAFIAGHEEFHQMTQFPPGLWEEMKERRLFGLGIGTEYDGHGADFKSVANCGKALVEHGGNLGIAMTWMMHELISRGLIGKFGSPDQKNHYLPKLASGEITASLAASEPNTGAHPKYIKTAAESVNGGYRINGEKTYLTNGPMAGLFVVIAITGHDGDKKIFTAFLVPWNTAGLTVAAPLELPILRPSPHGGIILKDCMVGGESVFGGLGHAYETIVKPFRELEDTMLMGPISGALQFQINQLRRLIVKKNIKIDDVMIIELGHLQCAADALSALARSAAERIDNPSDQPPVTPLTLFFRKQAADCQERINRAFAQILKQPDPNLTAMANDVTGGIRIASNVANLKLHKIGETFMRPARST